MSIDIGIVMDPIGSINTKKDSSLAMLLAAQRRGWRPWYMELGDLALDGDRALGRMRPLEVRDDPADWYTLGEPEVRPLGALDALLMRKDPPFDMEYVFSTYLLEHAQAAGCLVVNDPRSLRDANEKLFTARFPQCTPPTLVTASATDIRAFLGHHGEIVLKPLDGMGGASVFRVGAHDPNLGVIIETLTLHGRRYCMAQRYLPEIADGDKRILMVDGEPVPYCLARIPAPGESRGNLAAGASAEARALSERERWIAAQVGPELRARGILFAGLDVIGDHLTEINVTSPTCIRELDAAHGLDIAGALMDRIAARLDARD
ncbi:MULTISPECIES: glutathione synthase [unclassified Marichromatium]|uniref:glutathione synthase n=1 Tax=unclassified Marichromatium TaxID=2618417 RepID=UPI000F41E4F4|nr:glutathione synthase [Marichromatium sp. AB31]MBO8086099.1 glutathione synthase [Marichromatium sp.]RNE88425.1 glutathione synthase [Marichromatium sp. AB31]